MDNKKLTTTEAANELGVVGVTVLRWCENLIQGKDSPFKPGECWRAGRRYVVLASAVQRIKSVGMPETDPVDRAAEPAPAYDPDQTTNGHAN